MKKIKVDKVILYYMDRVDPDGNLYRFYVYKDMASEIEGDYIPLYTTTKKQSLTSTYYNLITIFIKMLLWGCLHFQISISLPSRIRVKT